VLHLSLSNLPASTRHPNRLFPILAEQASPVDQSASIQDKETSIHDPAGQSRAVFLSF
jgi:hypothetical protein